MTMRLSLPAGRARSAGGRALGPTWAALLIGTALAAGAAPARAQLQAPPHNVVSLAASATLELTTDWLTIVFSTTRDGPDAAGVQAQLRQALDSALEEARKVTRPGELNVRTGGFSLVPRHAPQGGGIVGWQGSAEMVVEGRDTTAISQLAGRVRTLGVGRVGWSLSREAREKVEGEVAAQAIARFRSKADLVARQFGFASWTVREVSVAASDQPGPPPLARMQAMRAASDESLPVEAGKALVSATVSGSVQMMK